jgi:hypothetical protein
VVPGLEDACRPWLIRPRVLDRSASALITHMHTAALGPSGTHLACPPMNHALCEALVACPSEISRHRALSDSPAETGFLGRPGGLERPDAVWMHNMEAVDPNKPGCEPRLPWVPLGVASVAGFEWVMTLRLWENGAHNNHSRRGASLAATSNKSSLLRLPRTARRCNPCSDRNMSCGHQAGWVGIRRGPPTVCNTGSADVASMH